MVQPVNLFALASQQAKWLAARQSAVAGNIANVNTPGYGAVDIEPFEQVLNARPATLTSTQPNHIAIGAAGGGFGLREEDAPNLLPSGNSVSMEKELMKAGEVRRAFELNTAIVKSFHRMMMMNTRS